MRELVTAAFARYRWVAAACALSTLAAAALVQSLMPELWRVEVAVAIREPAELHRLANPFFSPPDAKASLQDLEQELVSDRQLIAVAKNTGLVDRYPGKATPARAFVRRLFAHLHRPLTEKETLDAIVDALRKEVKVTVDGRQVRVLVEWSDRETAAAIAAAELEALAGGRTRAELEVVGGAARSVELRLQAATDQMQEHQQRIAGELSLAEQEGRLPEIAKDMQALVEARSRATELLMREEDQRIQIDVVRRAGATRVAVLEPPSPPLRPVSAGALTLVWTALLALALSALSGPVAVALVAGRLETGRAVEAAAGVPVLARLDVGVPGRVRAPALAVLVALGIAVSMGAALALGRGSPLVTFAPALVIGGAWLVATVPLKWPLLALMLAAVTCDDPTDMAFVGLWRSPLHVPGRFLFTNVAWFTGFELAFMGLFALMVARRSFGARVDPKNALVPLPLRQALLLSAGWVVALIGLGIVRGGGDFRQALWQFRFLLMLPLVASLCLTAFDFPKDLRLLVGVLFTGSVVKSALGAYFALAIVGPRGLYAPHTTGHNDTMLYVTAAMTALALLWERPKLGSLVVALGWLPIVAVALKYNDRRIAYVNLIGGLVALYLMSPASPVKRFVSRTVALLVPVFALYVAAGWNSRFGSFYAPVQTIRSLIEPEEGSKEESSNVDRDIENFNLTAAWRRNPIFGEGFGHAFPEIIPSNDFSQSNFGHVGHNSLLWLLWIGGVVGLSMVLLHVAVALFFLGRTLGRATRVQERIALWVALSILVTYLSQSYGDMGTQSIAIDLFVAAAIAISGQLATRHGVWMRRPA